MDRNVHVVNKLDMDNVLDFSLYGISPEHNNNFHYILVDTWFLVRKHFFIQIQLILKQSPKEMFIWYYMNIILYNYIHSIQIFKHTGVVKRLNISQ